MTATLVDLSYADGERGRWGDEAYIDWRVRYAKWCEIHNFDPEDKRIYPLWDRLQTV